MGKASDSQMALPQYLRRPWKRIDEYISLLKGFIKYSRRAEDDCTQLEEAVKMFLQLRHQADDLMVLQQISGFAGSLDPLGPVLAHVSIMAAKDVFIYETNLLCLFEEVSCCFILCIK